MMKGEMDSKYLTKESLIEVLKELGVLKVKKGKRNYEKEILDLLKESEERGEGGIDCLELRTQMKCSNSDFYIHMNQLLREGAVIREANSKKGIYFLK